MRSTWFGGLLPRRARTSCHTDSGCDRNACANGHPVPNFCAAHPSAPVRRIASPKNASPPRTDAKKIPESATKLGGRAALLCQRVPRSLLIESPKKGGLQSSTRSLHGNHLMRREIFQSFGCDRPHALRICERVFRCGARNSVEIAIPRQNARSKFRKKLYVSESRLGRWLHRLVRCFHSPLIDRMNPGRSSSRFYRIRKSRQMSLRVHQ